MSEKNQPALPSNWQEAIREAIVAEFSEAWGCKPDDIYGPASPEFMRDVDAMTNRITAALSLLGEEEKND